MITSSSSVHFSAFHLLSSSAVEITFSLAALSSSFQRSQISSSVRFSNIFAQHLTKRFLNGFSFCKRMIVVSSLEVHPRHCLWHIETEKIKNYIIIWTSPVETSQWNCIIRTTFPEGNKKPNIYATFKRDSFGLKISFKVLF